MIILPMTLGTLTF